MCVCVLEGRFCRTSFFLFSSCSVHAADGISLAVYSQVDANEISKLAAKAKQKQEIRMAAEGFTVKPS